mgnify:CR=1 FL=1
METVEDSDLLTLVRLSSLEQLWINLEKKSTEEKFMLIIQFQEIREKTRVRVRITEEVSSRVETEEDFKVATEADKDRIQISKERLLIFNKVLIIYILFLIFNYKKISSCYYGLIPELIYRYKLIKNGFKVIDIKFNYEARVVLSNTASIDCIFKWINTYSIHICCKWFKL